MQMRSVPLYVALQPFVFPAGEAVVLGLYTVWLSLTHSETLQLKAAFPRGSTRLVKLLLLVSENRHFSSSKAHFHVLPQSWNIKRRCFLQHTNQPAKSLRPICWVCLCFFSLSRLFKHKISVSRRVCDDILFLVELSAPSLEAFVVFSIARVGSHQAATGAGNTAAKMMPNIVITIYPQFECQYRTPESQNTRRREGKTFRHKVRATQFNTQSLKKTLNL